MISIRSVARNGAVTVTAGVLCAGAVALSGVASADVHQNAGTRVSGTEYFTTAYLSGDRSEAILWGPLTGGTNKDDNSHDNYDVVTLKRGSFRLNHPDSQSTFTMHVNPTTCHGTFTLTGKYTISHGTGAYATATGHGTYRGTGQAILGRTKSGACDEQNEPLHEVFTVSGHGPFSYVKK